MSKVMDMLRKDVAERFGECALQVIDYLYDTRTLDDSRARNHMVKVEVFHRLLNTDLPVVQIDYDVAEDLGLSRDRVKQIRLNG